MANINVRQGKRLCSFMYENNVTCKGIALSHSDYCRHHAKEKGIPLQGLTMQQQNRYVVQNDTVRARINNNLASPSLLDLRHEIALLQSWLQELLDAPVVNFEKQLMVIDRIEKLVTNFQRIRLSAAALAQAENKVKLVINNVVLIIKSVVNDKEQRQEIARRLAALGLEYEKKQEADTLGLGLGINTEAPINTEPLAVDTLADAINTPGLAQADAARGARGTGDPAPGKETEQDIPSPSLSGSPDESTETQEGGVPA